MDDYALFAKFKVGNKTIIVCGGITAEATTSIGLCLKSHWQDIYTKLKDAKHESLKPDDPFAVVIKFHGKRAS